MVGMSLFEQVSVALHSARGEASQQPTVHAAQSECLVMHAHGAEGVLGGPLHTSCINSNNTINSTLSSLGGSDRMLRADGGWPRLLQARLFKAPRHLPSMLQVGVGWRRR